MARPSPLIIVNNSLGRTTVDRGGGGGTRGKRPGNDKEQRIGSMGGGGKVSTGRVGKRERENAREISIKTFRQLAAMRNEL